MSSRVSNAQRSELAREFLVELYETRILKTWLRDRPEGWETVSGNWTPFYFSMRDVPSYPNLFRLTTRAASVLLTEAFPRANWVVGIASTGIPLAAATALSMGLPMGFTRKLPGIRNLRDLEADVTAYGNHSLVEGQFRDGDRIVLLDDVVSHFDSKEIALRQLELEISKRGLADVEVEGVAVLVDRGIEARERAAAAGIRLASFISLHEDGLDMLTGTASDREIEAIRHFIHDHRAYQSPTARDQLLTEAGARSATATQTESGNGRRDDARGRT